MHHFCNDAIGVTLGRRTNRLNRGAHVAPSPVRLVCLALTAPRSSRLPRARFRFAMTAPMSTTRHLRGEFGVIVNGGGIKPRLTHSANVHGEIERTSHRSAASISAMS